MLFTAVVFVCYMQTTELYFKLLLVSLVLIKKKTNTRHSYFHYNLSNFKTCL